MGEVVKEEIKVNNEEDEESVTKRQCYLNTKVQTDRIRASPDWESLPCHLIVQIYSYLKNSDRLLMAQVCRAWYTSFQDPSLWRSMRFNIGGIKGKRKTQKMIKFASILGRGLKNLNIIVDQTNSNTRKFIRDTLEKLIEQIANMTLSRVTFSNFDWAKNKTYMNLKQSIGGSLVKMLQSQRKLKHVSLWSTDFYHGPGTEVLKALQDSSGQILESLELINYFETGAHDSETSQLKLKLLPSDLEGFTNLRTIRVHYSYISDDIVDLWTITLKDKLERIIFEVRESGRLENVITSKAWMKLGKACPKLKVAFCIYPMHGQPNIIQILTPGMPLTEITILSAKTSDRELQLSFILAHLADNFDARLEGVNVWVPFMKDSVDSEIIKIVENCRKLKTMRVSLPENDAFRVANAISNDFPELADIRLEKRDYFEPTNNGPYQDVVLTFNDRLSSSSD